MRLTRPLLITLLSSLPLRSSSLLLRPSLHTANTNNINISNTKMNTIIKTLTTASASNLAQVTQPQSWAMLSEKKVAFPDRTTGPTNPQALLRLFNNDKEEDVRITLYRDHHAWCPYCQKIWLYLEEHRLSYRIRKVTMFCYGDKEPWYKHIVPSGMLPAAEVDGRVITESDEILFLLDETFGPLTEGEGGLLRDGKVTPFRRLERKLFSAWCTWLCRENSPTSERSAESAFISVAAEVDSLLASTPGPYFTGPSLSIVDIIFTPYIERMSASLTYYKGYSIRANNANIDKWFTAMETRSTYIGTQSDFHTHVHDLPPQMGMCVPSNNNANQQKIANAIDSGLLSDNAQFESSLEIQNVNKYEALTRVITHKDNLIKINPHANKSEVDTAIRTALTNMLTPTSLLPPPKNTAAGLRYIKSRINVPRDMSLLSARVLREALEVTAGLDVGGGKAGEKIRKRDRRDQDPKQFWV